MKMIILAAGQGTRLRPLTDEKPKCMVEYKGKSIIDYIIEAAKETNITNIAIVNGYKKEVLEKYLDKYDIKFYTNENYSNTNMVATLFCAKEFLNEDVIVSYADIIYSEEILQKLIDSPYDFSVVVDKCWRELWSQRMENPLDDAETLKIKDGYIVELGKKPHGFDEIEAQYIGLFKISKKVIGKVVEYYESLDQNKFYDGKSFSNMYMTSFIQNMIENLLSVYSVEITGGWLEIDCIEDLQTNMVHG
jgi:choline kinase